MSDRTTNQVEIEIAESDTSAEQNESAKKIDRIATLLRVREQGYTSAAQNKSAKNIDKIATLLRVREQGIASTRSTLQDIEVK